MSVRLMVCDHCGASAYLHYMGAGRKGWLFCDEGQTIAPSFTLDEIAETYRVAGRSVPQALGDKIRRVARMG